MEYFEEGWGPFKKIMFRRPCCGTDEGLSGEPCKGWAGCCRAWLAFMSADWRLCEW